MSGQPPPQPPTTQPTKFNKGESTDALTQKFAVNVPATAKFAADIRKLLVTQNHMTSTDVFLLPPDNYALSKADEATTAWTTLEAATDKVRSFPSVSRPSSVFLHSLTNRKPRPSVFSLRRRPHSLEQTSTSLPSPPSLSFGATTSEDPAAQSSCLKPLPPKHLSQESTSTPMIW